MKIGIICRGRTHSSAVISTLSKKYLCKPIGENFQPHSYVMNQSRRCHDQELDNTFKKYTFQIHKNMFLQKRFVSKIWPSMLILPPNKIEKNETFFDFEQKIIFDIEKHIFLSKYDKLYFLDRDLYESTLSWVYAKKSGVFQKHKKFYHSYHKIELDDNDYAIAKFYILEYCLQQKIKQYLYNSNLLFTEISAETFEFETLQIEKSNNDYESLIVDVDNLKKFIDTEYHICLESIKNWTFY